MEENVRHFQHIMVYYFKKSKNTTKTQKKICAVCGEDAVTDQMCQNWFVKFHAGDFSLDDAPPLGRPAEVNSDQIETLIVNSQRSTIQEIASILKISKSMKLLVKMKNVSFILRKKLNRLFEQPDISSPIVPNPKVSELQSRFWYLLLSVLKTCAFSENCCLQGAPAFPWRNVT